MSNRRFYGADGTTCLSADLVLGSENWEIHLILSEKKWMEDFTSRCQEINGFCSDLILKYYESENGGWKKYLTFLATYISAL